MLGLNWSVRNKLLAGFALLLSLLVLLIWISFQQITQLDAAITKVVTERLPKIEAAKSIAERGLINGALLRDAFIASNTAQIEQAINTAQENRQKNREPQEFLQKSVTSNEGKRLLDAMMAARARLGDTYEPLFEALRKDKTAAAQLIVQQYGPANADFLAAANALIDFQRQQMQAERVAAEQTAAAAKKLMLASAIAGVMLGLLTAFWIERLIVPRLKSAERLALSVAKGDLTHELNGMRVGDDEVGHLLRALDEMQHSLRKIVQGLQQDASELSHSVGELSVAADEVGKASLNQSQATASAAAAIEQLTVSIDQVAEHADEADVRAERAGEMAVSGGVQVEASSQKIASVALRVEQTTHDLNELNGKVQSIGNIADLIHDIADQTNLLALNAAIEAARAGEQGRGFAVVADEVRKLAERTTQSVQQIAQMLQSIQAGTLAAVEGMQESRLVVNTVVSSAAETKALIGQIEEGAQVVGHSVDDIANALAEQKVASAELARRVEQIAQAAEENTAIAAQVVSSSHSVAHVAGELKQASAFFKLPR
ncbi:methyl-accepting chemotaxis protein [Chitinibacter bivalviorum]|uniref:Methyl-accepting chemotaxis protein n=1 Tax=Chitinibacter bivalviorum TaxID=2739434 RepID=A0A7H9BIJ6_9NEIS|nr:methyl-accepting chemotaxis protein [Chitinibacter bivalviorum]QLG88543.1 methyl-accepting chemotaxis protein [Chitinibacter bivalviorum]